MRSPLHPWISNPEHYYRSVTAHGTVMGYVFPTLVAMGFGYAITEASLKRPLIGLKWAWAGWILVAVGTVTALIPVSMGLASVLYTFYPPMIGNPFYYIGVVLVVVGSWIWVALMAVNVYAWKRANPGAPVPLPMYANVAGSLLVGLDGGGRGRRVAVSDPAGSLGLRHTVDAGLGARVLLLDTARDRVFLADTRLHRLLHHRAAGHRRAALQRFDGASSFALFLVVAMPIGIHHLFSDPQVGAGFKFVHSVFTALVAVPTFLTVFTISASVEIAARLARRQAACSAGSRRCLGTTR